MFFSYVWHSKISNTFSCCNHQDIGSLNSDPEKFISAKIIAQARIILCISYTLGHEYQVIRNRYSRLLFTSEDRLCANLRVQKQSTNMTSQCL